MDGHIVSASMCIRMGIIYHRMQWLIFLKVGYTQLTAGSLSNVISMLKILHKSPHRHFTNHISFLSDSLK